MASPRDRFGPAPFNEIHSGDDVLIAAEDGTLFPGIYDTISKASPGLATIPPMPTYHLPFCQGRPVLQTEYPPNVVHDMLSLIMPCLPNFRIDPKDVFQKLMLVDAILQYKIQCAGGTFLLDYFGPCAAVLPADAYALAVNRKWEDGITLATESCMRIPLRRLTYQLPQSPFYTQRVMERDDGQLVSLWSTREREMGDLLRIEFNTINLSWLELGNFAFFQCGHLGGKRTPCRLKNGNDISAAPWFLNLCRELRDRLRESPVPETIAKFAIRDELRTLFCAKCGKRTIGDLKRFLRLLADATREVVTRNPITMNYLV